MSDKGSRSQYAPSLGNFHVFTPGENIYERLNSQVGKAVANHAEDRY